MNLHGATAVVRAAVRRALRILARPVRKESAASGIVVRPYRGYGTGKEVFVAGRVFRSRAGRALPRGTGGDLAAVARRLLRRSAAGVELALRFGGDEQRVVTDGDGYFRGRVRPRIRPSSGRLWHSVEVEPVDVPRAAACASVFIPTETARYVVISDIDDTVMFTGVANKAKMLWRLFVQGADSRVAFPGVGAFYRALHRGRGGAELNPLLYVSRGPWSLYDLLEAFFNIHRIPVGPILFLRDWGVRLWRPFPRRSKGHKRRLISDMLALYRDLPFVLVGDSGQRDPEIYARMVRVHPGRVLAVYIRNVSVDAGRERAIAALAEQVAEAGSSLLLAADTFAMAEHASARGLISSAALAEVLRERHRQDDVSPLRPVLPVRPGEKPSEADGVRKVLRGSAEPPNIVVDPPADETDENNRREVEGGSPDRSDTRGNQQ